MKKIVALFVCLLAVSLSVRADDDRPIQFEQLPSKAQAFVKEHFPQEKVALAKMEKDFFDKKYEVIFANSSKVEFLKFNARNLSLEQTKTPADFVCLDCSFISLKLLLKPVCDVLKSEGEAVVLIKPQFEVGKKALSKNGIVTDKKAEREAVNSIKDFAVNLGFTVCGIATSPKKEEDKNTEYLLYLKK